MKSSSAAHLVLWRWFLRAVVVSLTSRFNWTQLEKAAESKAAKSQMCKGRAVVVSLCATGCSLAVDTLLRDESDLEAHWLKGNWEQRPETAGVIAAVQCEAAHCVITQLQHHQSKAPEAAITLLCSSPLNEACQDNLVIISLFFFLK